MILQRKQDDTETPMQYLLRRLAEEGRNDLVEEYQEQSRRYTAKIAAQRKERELTSLKQSLGTAIAGTAWHARLVGRIARAEVALAKLKEQS